MSINAAWRARAPAADLLAWTQSILLDGDLAIYEPNKVRYRRPHCYARVTRGQRKAFHRVAEHRPWATEIARAFQRLRLIPRPLLA